MKLNLSIVITGIIILVVCILFLLVFDDNKPNNSITDKVSISFLDNSNSINISNLDIISDDLGKTSGNYLEFNVTGIAINNLKYNINLIKDNTSTLSDDLVKVYLTEVRDDIEYSTYNGVVSFSNLVNSSDDGKIIYSDIIKPGEVAYGRKFRLRAWISNKDALSQIRNFKLSVNISY